MDDLPQGRQYAEKAFSSLTFGGCANMKRMIALLVLALPFSALGQSELATFRTEVRNTFVWGEDASGGAESSLLKDPLTGSTMLRLGMGM